MDFKALLNAFSMAIGVTSIYPTTTFLVVPLAREFVLHLAEDEGSNLTGGILFAAGLAQAQTLFVRCLEGMGEGYNRERLNTDSAISAARFFSSRTILII